MVGGVEITERAMGSGATEATNISINLRVSILMTVLERSANVDESWKSDGKADLICFSCHMISTLACLGTPVPSGVNRDVVRGLKIHRISFMNH